MEKESYCTYLMIVQGQAAMKPVKHVSTSVQLC